MAAEPILSVVVTVVSDTAAEVGSAALEGCLDALCRQSDAPPFEIIVTCDARFAGVAELRRHYPEINFIAVEKLRHARHGPSREHHDELRGIGMRAASASLIALLEDCGRPDPGWAASLVREHRQPYVAVGGAMENGVDRALNWAVYFGDFGRYQNPVLHGPSPYASDANVCYKRAALEAVNEVWSDSYNEARVHGALAARGEMFALSPDVIVYQFREDLRLGPALTERRVWGRSFAAVRVGYLSLPKRIIMVCMSPVLPFILVLRQGLQVFRKSRNRAAFFRALPLSLLLSIAWVWGEFTGYVTGRP